MVRRLMPEVVHGQRLVELPGTATVREAARLMAARNVGSVLVIARDRRLEGIVTERDIVHRVVVPGRDPDCTRLHEVMTKNPDTIGPNEPAIAALRRMRDGGCRHLPVVDEDGRPVRIQTVVISAQHREEVDVDTLLNEVQRASDLLAFCQQRLKAVGERLEQVLEDFEQ